MQAIVFSAKGQVEVWDHIELPALGPADIEVQSVCTGVSPGTEQNLLMGGNYSPGFPNIPGYQIVGRVVRAGPEATNFGVGQRVYAHFWGQRFPSPELKGHGAHAASHVGPTTCNIMALPDDLPDEEAALLSLSSIGLHCVRRATITLGQKVLVLGLGIIGQFACQAVRVLGGRAFGMDMVPSRLEKARQLGCEAVFDGRNESVWEQLAQVGPFDAVIETTSINRLVKEILERKLLVQRGAIVLVGGRFVVEYPFNVAQFCEATILHTSHHTNQELAEVIRLRQAGAWQITPLISHRAKIAEAPTIWQTLLGVNKDWLGVVFEWT